MADRLTNFDSLACDWLIWNFEITQPRNTGERRKRQLAMTNSTIPDKNLLKLTLGCVTQGNNSCNLSCNGVFLLARQVAGMVFHCAMIVATCFVTATTEDSGESTKCFNWLMSTNRCKTSCTNHCKGQTLLKKIVVALLQSLRKVEASSTFRNSCSNKKSVRNVPCGVCYSGQFFYNLCQQNCETSCAKCCLV